MLQKVLWHYTVLVLHVTLYKLRILVEIIIRQSPNCIFDQYGHLFIQSDNRIFEELTDKLFCQV